jgi:hypothetical protein
VSTETLRPIPSQGRPVGGRGPTLSYRITPVDGLTSGETEEMVRLFRTHFTLRNPETFLADLARKRYVIRLLGPDNRLLGFSTITSYPMSLDGRALGVVYSGDTIIRRESWGTSTLPKAWLRAVLTMAADLPRPLYWLLLSSGYRTYRMLPVFFREFYPRFDASTPKEMGRLLHHLGRNLVGAQFDADRGVIRFGEGATALRPGLADPGLRQQQDPHTSFFLRMNPGHARGDELVCIAEISDENLNSGGRRILKALGMEALPW